MAIADVNRTIIQIVNEVERKLGVNPTTSVPSVTRLGTVLVDFLNDVMDEVADHGDWPALQKSVVVTAVASTTAYEVNVSAPVKTIHEIHFSADISPLRWVTPSEIRRLNRSRSYGRPRHYSVVEVSGVNPIFRVSPIPGSAQGGSPFEVSYFEKPILYEPTTAYSSIRPIFPSRVLVQGTYAKALLDESGGQETPAYRMAYGEYQKMLREAFNRFTSDFGDEIQFVPTGPR